MAPVVTNQPQDATAVEVRNLSLRAGHRQLLVEASARFEPGQITLIVGPSGAGKSLLLRVLAGLIGPGQNEIAVSGELYVADRQVLGTPSGFQSIGVVFQNFALFDELSPLDNVRFAADHRRTRPGEHGTQDVPDPAGLLAELGVPLDVRTASLSGGQRQRLAIARTLAYDPEVILYDEPTSGLDAATAAQVAALIRTTHAAHGKTSIIVTHDDRALAPIADRVYLLDPATHTLRPIEREEWSRLSERMRPAPAAEESSEPATKVNLKPGPLRRAANYLADFFVGSSRSLEQALLFPIRLVPRWTSARWGFRYLAHYLRLVADPSAWLYIAVAGAITGYCSTYFTFRFLPFRSYTEPLIVENLLEALGFTIYRVFVPVLATMMVAARCGAAVSSDVGGKVYGQQIDAMRTFGADPVRYLATNIFYSFLVGTLLLVAIGFGAATVASQVVFTMTHPDRGPYMWASHFYYELATPGVWLYRGTGWLVAKLLVSAAGIGVITYDRGSRPKYSSEDVSIGITSTVLWTTLYVLVVHMAFAIFEFEPR